MHDAAELAVALERLLADPQARATAGSRGRAAIDANRGALGRVLGLIDRLAEAQRR